MLSVARPLEENACDGIGNKSKNEIPDLAEEYAQHEQSFVRKSRSLLKSLSEDGAVFLWGAGAKGVMYANLIDPGAECISGIVDVNPDKQGGFIPGSGHVVISPEQLPENGLVVVMNENYVDEIRKQISDRKAIQLCSVHSIGRQSS
ncbi:MAG: hypothetical protein BWY45_03510 [Euryarchaeota archaeon ADurb.Bin294]|nr:MAG: hypothetical protein BWY45_03510 [Euryarchaeota archaeon ADurb.Bin294]